MVQPPMLSPNSSRLLRATRFTRAALLLAVLALLAGCVRYNVDIGLHPDNQAQVQLDFAVENSAAEYLGEDPSTLWNMMAGEMGDQLPEGSTYAEYARDGWTGANISLPALPITQLSELDSLGIGMQVTREGNYFQFTGDAGNITDELRAEGMDVSEFESAEVRVTLRCPGDVFESNGTITGNQVVWNLLAMDGVMTATCAATGDAVAPPHSGGATGETTGFARWWPVLVLGLAILGSLIGLALYLRRKAHSDHTEWTNPAPHGDYEVGGFWEDESRG